MGNIVYIGGGVSTVFGVLKLLESGVPGKNITILEAGPDIYEREEKDVLKGFGGVVLIVMVNFYLASIQGDI